MTEPQRIRNRKLSASEMIEALANLSPAKSLGEECVNLELMGQYPDDPESRGYFDAARKRWHVAPLRLATEDELPDFASRTRTQVLHARELIHEDFEGTCVRLPWPSLHKVIGHGLLPYQLWTIAAASGHGKTTAAMNLIKAWVEMGKRVYVIPLEQPTDVMRVYLAALSLGFSTRYALANRWKDLPPSAQGAIESELLRQQDEDELLHFSDVDFLTVSGLPAVLKDAQDFGADVILIDHVHHVRVEGYNSAAEFMRLCQLLGEFTKNQRVPVIAMAQLNRGQGPKDRLKPYLPPDVDGIQMGKVLEQVSSVVMGLYRPLADWVKKKEFARIRLGDPVKPYLKPGTMAVSVLKSRISGDAGDIVDLTYDRGHISDPDRYEQEELYGNG